MLRWPRLLTGLLCWMLLGGLAPAAPASRLAYAVLDLDSGYGARLTQPALALPVAAALPVRSAVPGGVRRPSFARGVPRTVWKLAVEAGVTADSNVNSASDDRFVSVRRDGVVTPVPLDSAYRPRSGTGRGASATAVVRLRLSDGLAFVADAQAQATDYKGGRDDDISFLLAGGPELTWSGGGVASVQMIASQDRYGGRSADAGVGVRARYRMQIAQGHRISMSLDARGVASDYGRDFGGTQGAASLGYSVVLDPVMTGSLGAYARREWLRGDEFSNLELGAYGGVTRYLGSALTGSLSAGFSRTLYDAPLLYLSPDRRRDWRFNAGVHLTTRTAIGLGVYPSLSYSYNRTDGSIDFFDSERHRVRLGVTRNF